MFTLAHPWILTLIIPLIALAIGLGMLPIPRLKRKAPPAIRYSDIGLLPNEPISLRLRLFWIPTLLRLCSLTAIIFASARPQISHSLEVISGKGVDIVIALDISPSMGTLMNSNHRRLDSAIQVIDTFAIERQYDRIGLVVFSGEAFSQCPPTTSDNQLLQLLHTIDIATKMDLPGGTAIGMGLAQSITMLNSSDATSKVIILLTDGENNAGQIDPITAASFASALGIRIYAVSISSQTTQPLNSELNLSVNGDQPKDMEDSGLKRMSQATGGLYFQAANTESLNTIFKHINQLEKSDLKIHVYKEYRELSGIIILLAITLLILEKLLTLTIFRSLP